MICIYCSRPIKPENVVWVNGNNGIKFAYGSNCAKKLGLLTEACCDRGIRVHDGQKRFCECAWGQQLRASFDRTFSGTPNPAARKRWLAQAQSDLR